MYSFKSGLIVAFHGCDEAIRDKVIAGEMLKKSENKYDWLGHGFYFWENNYDRALAFADKSGIKKPSVLGAVIDLGYCLDLLDSKYLSALKDSYDNLRAFSQSFGKELPANKSLKGSDKLELRMLDCTVIENLHKINPGKAFDSVKGVFIEGEPLYEGAGINNKNHIQICIRNPTCIKGFFLPRVLDNQWDRV